MLDKETKIEAVVGYGRVYYAAYLTVCVSVAAVCAALTVFFVVVGGMHSAGYISAAVLTGCAAVFAAFIFVRQLWLKNNVKVWSEDAVRLTAQITRADGATLPTEIPMSGLHTPVAAVQLPVSDSRMLIAFLYNGRKIVKTVGRGGVYRKYAEKRTDILYSPSGDVVMLIGLTE